MTDLYVAGGIVDTVILSVVAWGAVIGWKRGGYRALLDFASLGGSVAVILFSVHWINNIFIQADWAYKVRKWIFEQILVVPTGSGLSVPGNQFADQLFHLLLVGGSSLAVWIGIQMILQVFQTIMREPAGTVMSRTTGGIIGSVMGSVISFYMVQCLGFLSWVKGLEELDLYMGRSVIVSAMHTWFLM